MAKLLTPTIDEQKEINIKVTTGVESGYLDDLRVSTFNDAYPLDFKDYLTKQLGAKYILDISKLTNNLGFNKYVYLDELGNLLKVVKVEK